jgi:hypothetical protein
MEKKEIRFTAGMQGEAGLELMKKDVERIQEITPGFQPPMQVTPAEKLQGLSLKPITGQPILRMPMKKEKME